MKRCLKCGEEKALDQFGKHKQKSDGLRAYCRPCNNADTRRWAAANPEKANAATRRWAAENSERSREIKSKSYERHAERYSAERKVRYQQDPVSRVASAVAWAKANPDRANKNKTRWRLSNPGKVSAASGRRNADRIRATPNWLSNIQLAQIEEFYEISVARSIQTGVKHHVDHIHPLRGGSFNGLHVPWNLQVLTAEDNLRKGAQLVEVP